MACGRWQAVAAVTAVAAAAHPLESIRSSTVLQVITAKDFHVAHCTLHMQLLLCYSYEHCSRPSDCADLLLQLPNLLQPPHACPHAMLDIWISMGLVGVASTSLPLSPALLLPLNLCSASK